MLTHEPRNNEQRLFDIARSRKDLGGFLVRRSLPAVKHRTIGPFVFFDHFGPASIQPGNEMQVRPHPHIQLATMTYLFQGAIEHRDSLGTFQLIEPGAINWMTAGRGIVHSERGPKLTAPMPLHGIQLWIGLPVDQKDVPPAFVHVPADQVPSKTLTGEVGSITLRVMAGTIFDVEGPVEGYSPTLYAELEASQAENAGPIEVTIPKAYAEMGLYVVGSDATLQTEGATVVAKRHQMVSLNGDRPITVKGDSDLHIMLIGGAPFPEPRHMFWNFVSADKGDIDEAVKDWGADKANRNFDRFPLVPEDEEEFIPVPARST